jgi:hypothetical protein
MAGFIIACSRNTTAPSLGDDLRRLALHLAPDNITPNAPHGPATPASLRWRRPAGEPE